MGFAEERVEVEAGKKVELKLRVRRHWPDFREKLTVLPLPAGPLQAAGAEIAAGKDEGTVTVAVPAGAPAGEYTLTVLGQAQVPYSKEPKAAAKPNTLVSLPARPATVVVVAAVKK